LGYFHIVLRAVQPGVGVNPFLNDEASTSLSLTGFLPAAPNKHCFGCTLYFLVGGHYYSSNFSIAVNLHPLGEGEVSWQKVTL
jgi:hypothetical protein